MTGREAQLLKWIKENPMISQQELADRAGITRSSAAVHISNLMKKGYIAGRGYVVSEPSYTVVVGGLNRDIGGIPYRPLVPRDSNPGKVSISIGGVGRNIAHNMSLLDIKVSFLTALGDDEFTDVVTASCLDLGIDINKALRVRGETSATYLFIADEHGDMEIALSDMDIFRHVTTQYLEKHRKFLDGAEAVVADTNIPEESLAWLSENCRAPLFVDPVSTIKAEKIKNLLGKIHTLKPNKLEAEYLSGIKITGEESLERATEKLLSTGLKRVFISLGSEGAYCAEGSERVKLACPEADLVNTTGGGDAFMAGLVWAWLDGRSLEESGKIGLGAGAVAVEAETTINHEMCIEKALAKGGLKR